MATHSHSAHFKKIINYSIVNYSVYPLNVDQLMGAYVQNSGSIINYRIFSYHCKLHAYGSNSAITLNGTASWVSDYYDRYGYGWQYGTHRDLSRNGVITSLDMGSTYSSDEPLWIVNFNIPWTGVLVMYIDLYLTQFTD
jgi:hypothetical protein